MQSLPVYKTLEVQREYTKLIDSEEHPGVYHLLRQAFPVNPDDSTLSNPNYLLDICVTSPNPDTNELGPRISVRMTELGYIPAYLRDMKSNHLSLIRLIDTDNGNPYLNICKICEDVLTDTKRQFSEADIGKLIEEGKKHLLEYIKNNESSVTGSGSSDDADELVFFLEKRVAPTPISVLS